MYSTVHATQALEALNGSPSRPTDWALANVHHRDRPFATLRAEGMSELRPDSRLYVPTNRRLGSDEAEASRALREQVDAIVRRRKKFAREQSGRCGASVRRAAANKAEQARLQALREKEVEDHIAQHGDKVLAYRIAFDKFDGDGSGSIDATELAGCLKHLGLDVSGGDTVARLMEKYDRDHNGLLSFDEFATFASEALRDKDSKSLFLRKKAMAKSTKNTLKKNN